MSVASEVYADNVRGLIAVSTWALYIFDSCATFPQEVDVIWTRRWSTTSWIYLSLRYLALLYVFVPLFAPNPTGPESCKALSIPWYIFEDLQFVPFALFSAIRVYALLGGTIFLAAVVCALDLVPFATNTYHFANVTRSWLADTRECIEWSDFSFKIVLRFTISTRVAVILADVLVLLVTWSKTACLYKEARRLNVKAPLATLLFRDGTLQFLILLTINILTPLAVSIPSLAGLDFATPFMSTLQPLLICRFILNLRQIKPAGSSWVTGSQSASLRFAGDVGHLLGASELEDEDNEHENELSALARELNVLNHSPEAEAPTEPSQSSVAPEAGDFRV